VEKEGASDKRRAIAACATAGIVMPFVFTIILIGQGLRQPGYSHVSMPISALSAHRGGWIQNVNFLVCGVLFIAFAIGLHLGVRPNRGGDTGPALLVLSGVGTVVIGMFPWRDVGGSFIEPTGHVVGVFMAFLGAGIGFAVIARRLAGDPHWQSATRYTLATGMAIVALFFGFGALAESADAPLHQWAGIVQRLLVGVWFICTVVLGLRLRRTARAAGHT
jgi:hypothetical membrane protein